MYKYVFSGKTITVVRKAQRKIANSIRFIKNEN